MINCNILYSSKINGEVNHYKTKGTFLEVDGKLKTTFLSADTSQSFTFIVFKDGSCLLKCTGSAKYQIKFKKNVNYPFTVYSNNFSMFAEAKTNSISSKIFTNKLELNIDYDFILNKDVDRRNITLTAEVFND